MLRFSENVNGRTDGAIQCAASTFEIPTDMCPGVRSSCKAVFEAEPKKMTGTSVTGGIGNPKAKALFASPQLKKWQLLLYNPNVPTISFIILNGSSCSKRRNPLWEKGSKTRYNGNAVVGGFDWMVADSAQHLQIQR